MTEARTEKILKEISRLNLARQDFLGVKALAEKFIANPIDPLDPIFRPCMAGIVTTYSRSFVRNDGLGPLGEPFISFDDESLKDTHAKLLRLRHKAYAHRDTLAVSSFTGVENSASGCYQLQIRVDDGGNYSLCSNAPELDPENLPNVVKLCAFQSQRTNDAVVKLLRLVIKRDYPPGIYTTGVDFP
jgi:hypothetical protein